MANHFSALLSGKECLTICLLKVCISFYIKINIWMGFVI